jgi:pyruvate/2-oxoglutarate dehydrogenase complex dihydrolipoamide acyltransferase (E2) component
MWWLGLNLWGRVRAYFYGTFGLTGVGAYGASALNLVSPLTTTLTYGVFESDGSVDVRLSFDHRVMDGASPARALAALEEVLNGAILEELRGMKGLAQAA